jgi:hypothetical protein
MRRKPLVLLLIALTVALPLSLAGMPVGHASADPGSNSPNSSQFCDQNSAAVEAAVLEAVTSLGLSYNNVPLTLTQPPVLDHGACVSLVSTSSNGTYATSAPFVSVCQALAASNDITDPNFQGVCVSFFSSTAGLKQFTNSLTEYYYFNPGP